jgi:MFS family permease
VARAAGFRRRGNCVVGDTGEEVDAAVRGWAVGLQGSFSISGYGLAAMVFALIGIFPFGWRGLYALALLPLGLIIPLRRILPESKRFQRGRRVEGLRPPRTLSCNR